MSLSTSCPKCDAQFLLDDALAGKRVRCQRCNEVFTAPTPQPEEIITDVVEVEDEVVVAVIAEPEKKPLATTVHPDFARGVVPVLPKHVQTARDLANKESTIVGSQLVGGLDFGFRNPFAAVWGVHDATASCGSSANITSGNGRSAITLRRFRAT
jgi:predicted Zn finger-like uncharacterized protein